MAAFPGGLTEPNVITLRAQLAQKYLAQPTHLETLLTLSDPSRALPYANALVQDWQSIKIDWRP